MPIFVHGRFVFGDDMKMLTIAMLAIVTFLSGCVILPVPVRDGGYRHYGGDHGGRAYESRRY
jgi:hypothetical protein